MQTLYAITGLLEAGCQRLYTATARLHSSCTSAAYSCLNNYDNDTAPTFNHPHFHLSTIRGYRASMEAEFMALSWLSNTYRGTTR